MEAPQDTQFLIAKAVETHMRAAGRSENDLSKKTGIPHTSLHRNLKGTSTPFNVVQLGLIARELGMTVAELISPRRAA